MSSHMSSLCARKHRISQWVLIAGELMWGYEKHIFIREYEKLIWKSCMRNHMRTCKFLCSWCGMRNHAQENSYEDMRNPLFYEKVWELIWKSFMRNQIRTCEFLYSWCTMRNHAQENSYEYMKNPLFHEKVWELIWKSFMRNHAQENSYEDTRKRFFMRRGEKSCPRRNFSKFFKVMTFF